MTPEQFSELIGTLKFINFSLIMLGLVIWNK